MRIPNAGNKIVGFVPFPFGDLDVPESWDSVRAFMYWWFRMKCPTVFPVGAHHYRVDDATSITLFRHGQFQVELYMLEPDPVIEQHGHPGVEVITVRVVGVSEDYVVDHPAQWLPASGTLLADEEHGVNPEIPRMERSPGLMLAFQHWTCGVKPTTVAARWKGKTAGPLHEALIRAHNPGAYVVSGYADITRIG